MAEIRLPGAAVSVSVRTETGTIARTESVGSSCRSWSHDRSAPAQIAMTTSLTVNP